MNENSQVLFALLKLGLVDHHLVPGKMPAKTLIINSSESYVFFNCSSKEETILKYNCYFLSVPFYMKILDTYTIYENIPVFDFSFMRFYVIQVCLVS